MESGDAAAKEVVQSKDDLQGQAFRPDSLEQVPLLLLPQAVMWSRRNSARREEHRRTTAFFRLYRLCSSRWGASDLIRVPTIWRNHPFARLQPSCVSLERTERDGSHAIPYLCALRSALCALRSTGQRLTGRKRTLFATSLSRVRQKGVRASITRRKGQCRSDRFSSEEKAVDYSPFCVPVRLTKARNLYREERAPCVPPSLQRRGRDRLDVRHPCSQHSTWRTERGHEKDSAARQDGLRGSNAGDPACLDFPRKMLAVATVVCSRARAWGVRNTMQLVSLADMAVRDRA
ncbi:hypothetical protein L1887_49851 [Cichorium endivia]|nr:hypothetical protein L1887_49851 [Cichorium endivia]